MLILWTKCCDLLLQAGSRASVASRREEIRLGKRHVDCSLGLCFWHDELSFFSCCLPLFNYVVHFAYTDVSFCGSEMCGPDVVAVAASLLSIDYGTLSFFWCI